MTDLAQRMLKQALTLTPEERVAVAEALLRSVGDRPGETGDAALGAEAGHRMDRFREGMADPPEDSAKNRPPGPH
jgi:hypothetical protein